MEEIRPLRIDELKMSIALSSFAFPIEEAETVKQIEQQLNEPEQIWGCFIQGKLAAKLLILPLQTFVQGRPVRMGGIALVATWPEYRRSGMVGRLIRRVLQAMKDSGQTISFLNPFAFAFYRKYGWETYTDRKHYTIETNLLPPIASTAGRIERVGDDWRLLNGMYEAYATAYNGTLQRDEYWWTNSVLQAKGQIAVYYDDQNTPKGYLLYDVKNRQLNVQELVYLDESARLSLWKLIANHDSMIDRVKIHAPVDDQLPFLLPNPRIKQEVSPYFMARIVDFAGFARQYPFTASGGADHILYVSLSDLHAPWNDGQFQLRVDGRGKAEVAAVSSESNGGQRADTGADSHLSCDIQTMACLLMGYQTPSFMYRIGRIQGDTRSVELLESLLPKRTTYLMDAF